MVLNLSVSLHPWPLVPNFDPYLSPQGHTSLSDHPRLRWVVTKDTGHMTEVKPITSASSEGPSRIRSHTHPLTSDLRVNTPEHPILLSQAFARFSSLHLLCFLFSFPFSSFLLVFFFNERPKGAREKNHRLLTAPFVFFYIYEI